MSDSSVVVHDIWRAALCEYLRYPLVRIEILDPRSTDWYFAAPSLDVDEYFCLYDSPEGLALSNAKEYSLAFMRLNRRQSDMRRDRQTSWCSPEWVEGKTASGRKVG